MPVLLPDVYTLCNQAELPNVNYLTYMDWYSTSQLMLLLHHFCWGRFTLPFFKMVPKIAI